MMIILLVSNNNISHESLLLNATKISTVLFFMYFIPSHRSFCALLFPVPSETPYYP